MQPSHVGPEELHTWIGEVHGWHRIPVGPSSPIRLALLILPWSTTFEVQDVDPRGCLR